MADDWDITTGDGSVSLYLPSDFGAELDAHTGDGTHPERPRHVDGPTAAEHESPHGQGPAWRRRQAASHPHRRRLDPPAPALARPTHSLTALGCADLRLAVSCALAVVAVGSSPPASRNASIRSRHLLHAPQWTRPRGCMHESVSSSGTPSERPRRITSALCSDDERRLDRDRGGQAERQRACNGCRRTPASHRETDFRRAVRSGSASIPRARHVDRRLRRAGRCCGPRCRRPRPACRSPARSPRIAQCVGGIHVAHVHLQRDERQ